MLLLGGGFHPFFFEKKICFQESQDISMGSIYPFIDGLADFRK